MSIRYDDDAVLIVRDYVDINLFSLIYNQVEF